MTGRTAAEILADAGPTVSIPEAATVLGISRGHGYALAGRGELEAVGVRVLRLGARWRVPTADLRRVLGVDTAA
ncbi:helix-turn-helix domain-containing protein [Actinophytocola oryzae]|uniref:Excisionase family DNA binding protein n=1 Tax=Actinophytocola oryzae TaxID=502181 RepID=A0A4R7UX54_9PSEU|nr:helix-turn-helix domain-containing protein [Actinophytocola oryzae]TDV40105.1 excisionase family DNA binding protein [Actinophytocola oryzae]